MERKIKEFTIKFEDGTKEKYDKGIFIFAEQSEKKKIGEAIVYCHDLYERELLIAKNALDKAIKANIGNEMDSIMQKVINEANNELLRTL